MAHDVGSMGRQKSPSAAQTKFVDRLREDRLGCLRSIVWIVVIEVVICTATIAVWPSIR
jgi:hypothetical protein